MDYFCDLTRYLMNEAFVQVRCSAEDRREQIVGMHADGWTITEMSKTLDVSYKTVQRDFEKLGLSPWTKISNEALISEVSRIIEKAGSYFGRRKIAAYLLTESNSRAPKTRILRAMVFTICIMFCSLLF
jgi:hypothetical protein